ncbi:MAG TPA: HAD family hydrolase, partial [Isosphaeraceae bacterium]
MDVGAVLFDLDGTLLDTLADIAAAANAVLSRHGLPAHPVEAYRRFIGDGVATLFHRALLPGHAEPERVARCVEDFRDVHGRIWNVSTRPYAGIPELLDALGARGLGLAILSNKPDEFTRLCAAEYLARWPFRAVLGQRAGIPRKPDPAGAWEIAGRLGLPTDRFLYVGDSAVDMETARRAGM